MVEKYRGLLPKNSIWFHLTADETKALINSHPEILAQLPPDKPIQDLNDIDIQAFPGKVEELEKYLTDAGLKIITLQN